MTQSESRAEILSRRYAEIGFALPPEEIEKIARRVEQVAASMKTVRTIDVSAHEPQTVFAPRRES